MMLKKFIVIACASLTLAGCPSDNDNPTVITELKGTWQSGDTYIEFTDTHFKAYEQETLTGCHYSIDMPATFTSTTVEAHVFTGVAFLEESQSLDYSIDDKNALTFTGDVYKKITTEELHKLDFCYDSSATGQVTVEFTFSEQVSSLTSNGESLALMVMFDLNNDSDDVNGGDLLLNAVSNEGSLFSTTDEGDDDMMQFVNFSPKVSVSGNTMSVSVDKAVYPGLVNLTNSTQLIAMAGRRAGGSEDISGGDRLPNTFSGFTVNEDTSSLSDPEGDVDPDSVVKLDIIGVKVIITD